jgi:hypothetical protein
MQILDALFKKSTCRQLGEYIRNVLLQNPITIKYRNKSLDEILSALFKIKQELNAIGNNFNQPVHNLHLLDCILGFGRWILAHESPWHRLVNKYL